MVRKLNLFVFIYFLSLCPGYGQINNVYTSYADTLILDAKKRKGLGSLDAFAVNLPLLEVSEVFDSLYVFPNSLNQIKGCRVPVDFKSTLDHIDMIVGKSGDNESCVIIDENENRDFSDNTIYTLGEFDWASSDKSIPITYRISNGKDTVNKASWVKLGFFKGSLLYRRDEHLRVDFLIGKEKYAVGITDKVSSASFTYSENSIMALLSESDTHEKIDVRDLIHMGEYIKLHDHYYRFDSINNDGSTIILIKEGRINNKIGTQVGLIAPSFTFRSMTRDTINSQTLNKKKIIIANTCGCGGDEESANSYLEIREKFQEEAFVLRLDSFLDSQLDKWLINMEDPFNKDLYDKYRKTYCSRICYLIDKSNRILDKFEITKWESTLPSLFDVGNYLKKFD